MTTLSFVIASTNMEDEELQMMYDRMTREELLSLPTVLGVEEAGRALGISRAPAYDLVAAGQFPVTVRKVGKRYRVLTEELLQYLGIDPSEHSPRIGASPSAEAPSASSVVKAKGGRVIRPDKSYRVRGRVWDGADLIEAARILGAAS